jgi:hypothetical protein
LKQKPLEKETTQHEQKEKINRRSQSPQTRRSSSPGKRNCRSQGDDTRNIITQARVNRSLYEWDDEIMRTRKNKWGCYALPEGFAECRYPKDSNYPTTSKSMMGHKNPNYGCQIIFKPLKYSRAQGQQQCIACSYTSPAHHGLG